MNSSTLSSKSAFPYKAEAFISSLLNDTRACTSGFSAQFAY